MKIKNEYESEYKGIILYQKDLINIVQILKENNFDYNIDILNRTSINPQNDFEDILKNIKKEKEIITNFSISSYIESNSFYLHFNKNYVHIRTSNSENLSIMGIIKKIEIILEESTHKEYKFLDSKYFFISLLVIYISSIFILTYVLNFNENIVIPILLLIFLVILFVPSKINNNKILLKEKENNHILQNKKDIIEKVFVEFIISFIMYLLFKLLP